MWKVFFYLFFFILFDFFIIYFFSFPLPLPLPHLLLFKTLELYRISPDSFQESPQAPHRNLIEYLRPFFSCDPLFIDFLSGLLRFDPQVHIYFFISSYYSCYFGIIPLISFSFSPETLHCHRSPLPPLHVPLPPPSSLFCPLLRHVSPPILSNSPSKIRRRGRSGGRVAKKGRGREWGSV